MSHLLEAWRVSMLRFQAQIIIGIFQLVLIKTLPERPGTNLFQRKRRGQPQRAMPIIRRSQHSLIASLLFAKSIEKVPNERALRADSRKRTFISTKISRNAVSLDQQMPLWRWPRILFRHKTKNT